MSDKWAIVTGASAGIGLDCARLLAKRGYNLVLVARSTEALHKIAEELAADRRQALAIPLDLSCADAPAKLVSQTDAKGIVPEVLINNAGVGVVGKFLETNVNDQMKMLQLNVNTLVELTHLYGSRMREAKCGYMLQVASTAAFQPLPTFALYAATKSLVLSFSRSVNFESEADGVSSTALCPGPTATKFFDKIPNGAPKALKMLMMNSEEVARQGIEAMFARREVVISGSFNRVGAAMSRLVPHSLMMRSLASLSARSLG